MNEYIVGLDAGSSKVSMAVGKITNNATLEILGLSVTRCEGIKKAVVVDIEKTAQAIKDCTKNVEAISGIEIKEIYLSLPSSICKMQRNKASSLIDSKSKEISQDDINRVFSMAKQVDMQEGMEIIGIELIQYIVDGYEGIKEPMGMSGNSLEAEVNLMVVETMVINNLLKAIQKAELKVIATVYQPTCLSKTILKDGEEDLGVAIVDMGAETLDLSILKNSEFIFTNSINIGGNIITTDISHCLKITQNEAEKVKVKYGDLTKNLNNTNIIIDIPNHYDDVVKVKEGILNEIINARVDEILVLLKQMIVESGYKENISGIVFVGSGICEFKGIDTAIKKVLDIPFRIENGRYINASNAQGIGALSVINEVYKYINIDELETACDIYKDNEELEMLNTEDSKESGLLSKVRHFIEEFF